MNQSVLYQWMDQLASHLPCFNSWQLENLALFTEGIVKAESSQQQQIARQVACGERVSSAARRLRRFIASSTVNVESFFPAWTHWMVEQIDRTNVTLLVDETKLNDRLGVMVVGVAWEARCIPLAWRCYVANDHAGYPSEGQVGMIAKLLQMVAAGIPDGCEVLLLADRGIGTSPHLCQIVADMGWHYLFRITRQSKIVTVTGEFTIYDQVQPGGIWQAEGRVFKQRGQIPAKALALWSTGYDEPWALVTNDPDLTGWEYAQRNWQEQSFRDLKSGGWQWEGSRVTRPAHMQRFMIVLVVAYAWMISLGSLAVEHGHGHPLQRHLDGTIRRHWSLFKEGLQFATEYVYRYGICPELCFIPDKRFT